MKKGGTRRYCVLGLRVSRGGAGTTGQCDNLKKEARGGGGGTYCSCGPGGRRVLGKGTGLSPRLLRMRTMDR